MKDWLSTGSLTSASLMRYTWLPPIILRWRNETIRSPVFSWRSRLWQESRVMHRHTLAELRFRQLDQVNIISGDFGEFQTVKNQINAVI